MVISGWTCENCTEFYDYYEDAKGCCSEADPAFQCTSCREVYDDELDADSCCFFESDCW